MSLQRAVRARWANVPSLTDVRSFGAELRGAERLSACRAVVDGLVVASTLRWRAVRPLLAQTRPPPAASRDPDRAVAVAAAVDAGLGMVPLASTCLRRSVTLLRELDRLSLEARLHIGVRTAQTGIEAHAWVQVGDVVVNDDEAVVAAYRELTGSTDHVLAHLR